MFYKKNSWRTDSKTEHSKIGFRNDDHRLRDCWMYIFISWWNLRVKLPNFPEKSCSGYLTRKTTQLSASLNCKAPAGCHIHGAWCHFISGTTLLGTRAFFHVQNVYVKNYVHVDLTGLASVKIDLLSAKLSDSRASSCCFTARGRPLARGLCVQHWSTLDSVWSISCGASLVVTW